MARFSDPRLFSTYFGLDEEKLDEAGLIDPFLDVDTPLFVDPVLLAKSTHPLIRNEAATTFRRHFGNFVRLLNISREEGDAAWRAAERLLNLREPPENGLGYGGTGRSGSSRPEDIRDAILRTSKEIIELGSDDPEMVSLMGFFEEGVGPDTISDFTSRVILDQLAHITEEFCRSNQIPVFANPISPRDLPRFEARNGQLKFVTLVPKDIVRDLPIARDWAGIEAAIAENDEIRQRVNALLAGIAEPTISERKEALRTAALGSPDIFENFLASVKEHAETYDPNEDALAYYKLKSIFAKGFPNLTSDRRYDLSENGPLEVLQVVHDTLQLFKHHVENGNLWEELWLGGKPKKERAAQLIYYAIADAFCKANNIDISPEANMGGGPIDFKFSAGYSARVLVEMKRSSGTVRHGYEKQLEIYREAAQTQYGIFVVMDFGDLGPKLRQILRIREARLAAGEQASDIVVIDATRKVSASKRR